MEALTELIELIRTRQLAHGHFLGMLHVLIGRRIVGPGGSVVSGGMTFRDVATLLRKVRWDTEAVRELGIDPDSLPPRDRQRYWFSAICQAGVDTARAAASAEEFIQRLRAIGYDVAAASGKGRSA